MTADTDKLIHGYIEGDLTPEQAAELSGWVEQNDANAEAFVRACVQHYLLREQAVGMDLAESAFSMGDTVAEDPQDLAGPGLMPHLAHLEAQAPSPSEPRAIHRGTSQPLTKRAYVSAMTYVFRHTFTARRVASLATAAAVLLGIVLTIVFIVGDRARETAEVPGVTPLSPSPDPNRVVATITGQTRAHWVTANGAGALPDRMLLAANQRLTLAKGFAEITTNRGAVVLVQAPATIETTDSDNAIRLHQGRLVGRCQTPSSRGFVVLTPNARIVDVGTEFGVELSRDGTLQTHVLDGEITLTPVTERGEGLPVSLRQGEARWVSADASRIQAIEADPYRFVRGMNEQDRDPMRGYVAEVMSMSPLLYYRFESIGLDGQIINKMGDRYYGRVVDRVSLEQTGAGMAARFDGGHIELEEVILEMAGLEAYTLECWIKPDRHQGAGILSFTIPDETLERDTLTSAGLLLNDNRPGFEQDQHNRARFVHRNPPAGYGGTEAIMKDPYTVGQWMHLVAVKQSNTMRLYINGELAIEVEEKTSHANVHPYLLIGTSLSKESNTDPRLFEGLIDEVAVYDKALGTDAIRRHFSRMNPLINPDQEGGLDKVLNGAGLR